MGTAGGLMVAVFALLLVVHGLIHLIGPARALGAQLPQLTQPVSPAMAAVWLAASLLMLGAAVSLWAWPRVWWVVALAAVIVSQVAIASAWTDARYGTVANVLVLVGVVFGFLAHGPASLEARYLHDVREGRARSAEAALVSDADLSALPPPVQRYVRGVGAVRQPHVVNFRAHMHGRIRSGPAQRWMPFRAEQYNFFAPEARLFYLRARQMLLPIQGYHRFVDNEATMLVKLGALVPVARGAGAQMTRAETVTLFNDMALFAPAALLHSAISWTAVDDHRAKARFTQGPHAIDAELVFNERDELVNFVSDDRGQLDAGSGQLRRLRWSTPVSEYRQFGTARLASRGQARWHEPSGEYAYIELTIDEVVYNVTN
jgi:hypothetical protein